MPPLRTLLLIQLIASAAMTGIIWLVQVAIYPLFAKLSEANFVSFHEHYMDLVTFVIAPLMLVEALTCFACFFLSDKRRLFIPSSLLGLAWLSTAFIQVPQHEALTLATVGGLVMSNWIRTLAWTARTCLLARIVIHEQAASDGKNSLDPIGA